MGFPPFMLCPVHREAYAHVGLPGDVCMYCGLSLETFVWYGTQVLVARYVIGEEPG